MQAITSLKSDIIFLSDLRLLDSTSGVGGSLRFLNSLRDNKNRCYEAEFNSNSNKRGVAILFASSLKVEKINILKDQTENIIAIHCKINGFEIMLCSIYGPNNIDRGFFRTLSQFLNTIPNVPKILGGDWNTVIDTSPVEDNIDIHNMVRIPNFTNCNLLNDMCEQFGLADPYRSLYPNKVDFSYSPFGLVRKNRSRLDFFVISSDMLNYVTDCTISPSKLNSLFDHKHITLTLNTIKTPNLTPKIKNCFLDHPFVKICVALSALQVYRYAIDPLMHPGTVLALDHSCNSIKVRLASLLNIEKEIGMEKNRDFNTMSKAALLTEIDLIFDDCPNSNNIAFFDKNL